MTPRAPTGAGGAALRAVVALLVAVLVVGFTSALSSDAVRAQEGEREENPLAPLDTSSPQATYLSFVSQVDLLEELLITYERDRTEANQAAFDAAISKLRNLFDFSNVADATADATVRLSFARLADILNRIPEPDIDEIPDAEAVAASRVQEAPTVTGDEVPPGTDGPTVQSVPGITSYRLPETEITITRISQGERTDEFAFSAFTVARLAGWRDAVDDLPVRDGVVVRDWVQEEADFTGHLVSRPLIDSLPDAAERDVLGSPLWKLLADLIGIGFVALVSVVWHRQIGRRGASGTIGGYLARLTTPIVVIVLSTLTGRLMNEQIKHSGDLALLIGRLVTVAVWLGYASVFWIVTRLVVEWLIETPRIRDESLDAHLVRMLGKVVGVLGAFAIVIIGLSQIGVPAVGLGVSAGVIGLAVSLSATSTLENLLGGIAVYLDKPFRVGDAIRVDDEFGIVEEIGPRSTSIRRLDDTQVTLPNADISRAKITNFSERNHILFHHVIGVRYETSVDQLRSVVDEMDSRLRLHPMVLDDDETPRVRVQGFGASSIDIEIWALADTQDYSEFLAVQQELLLMVHQIVEETGSGFAFPSTTTYLAADSGLAGPARRALVSTRDSDGVAIDDS